jgi:hypothetical protein
MTDSVNIVHWNCQGFNAHGPEYIWSLSKQRHIPDIFWYSLCVVVNLLFSLMSIADTSNKVSIFLTV